MELITRRGERFEYYEAESKLDLFSVTQIRKTALDTYAGIPEAVLEPARIRGTRLHRRFFFAIAALGGYCDYPAVLDDLPGYCASMDRWIAKRQPIALKLEIPGFNRRYRYAGTPDALLEFPAIGANGTTVRFKRGRILFDLKTGAPTKTDAMQLVAYDHMEDYKADELLDLYLDGDGGEAKEVFVPHGERAVAWGAFLNALNLLKWRVSL